MSLFKRKKQKREREYDLVAHTHSQSPLAEAFRTLRTNLGFADVEGGCRSILISSPSPRDGKSAVISNLAVVLAQADKKVILVDCDLRKPVQHRIFNLSNLKGLTNYLLDQVSWEEAVQSGPLPNLKVLTSGPIPPNPAEILGSSRTKNFWISLREEFDYILIDSPPVLAVTDSVILSGQVDGVILVLRPGTTRNNIAVQAKEQFVMAGARLLGVVFNQVRINSPDYQYAYYYYYGQSDSTKALMGNVN
jgi:protein-tyrosine kinase